MRNLIRPSPNSVFDIRNLKGIKLITRLRLGLSRLREHKFEHSFQDTLNPIFYVTVVKILSPLLTFSSTVPSLSALYVTLIVNYWIPAIMISTHPKLQAIISKSLTHRFIISYRVRDLTKHFFK